ncbi:MAG TPA: ice-binding family protein, partial [Candidatus Lokiarchaeia archaeon]|nr:ice-binding family protein [Candidatus Lokiarchaeia archaeon]
MIKGPKKIGNRQVIAKRKFSTATVIVIAALMVMIAMPTWKILTPATVPVEPRSPSTAVSSPLPVNLGSAGNYAILTQTGISSTGTTSIVGNIGVSPIAATAITGFGLTLDISGTFATSPLVTGNVYAASYVAPTPSVLTTAVSDMQTAYTNAAGRTADYSEFNAGNLGGQTLTTGVYKWSTGVTIPTSVTISGSSTDVWIFQIAGTLTVASATQVILSGGAQAKNTFWVVAGQTTLGTTSVINGNILDQTAIVFNSGATLNGRALAQTAVTLIANTVTEPAFPPLVVSTIPASLATGVLINSKIATIFSEAMDPTTINTTTYKLMQGSTPITGTVNYTGVTAVFTPSSPLASSTTYTANITTGAKDPTGNPLGSNYIWNFTTGAAPDITPPMVSSTVPVNNSVGILTNSKIAAIFSEAMDPLTINGTTFNITQGVFPVAGTVVYSVVTAVFTPTSALAPGTTYTANITTGVTDLAGNHMVSNYTWNFTTSSATLTPVNLGSAGNFAVLAESGISTTGTTSITGDIGVSPITATAITGFGLTLDASGRFATSSLVTGNVYAADYAVPTPTVLGTAISNMTAAYANATGRTWTEQNLYSGDIGGNTFSPGVYNWTSAVTMSSDITLTGSANDVWIFQVTGTLSTSNAARVILRGGAQSTNVFWVVTDTTVLGAGTLFNGNILDKTLIAFLSGAMLSGRALAQTAVTLVA